MVEYRKGDSLDCPNCKAGYKWGLFERCPHCNVETGFKFPVEKSRSKPKKKTGKKR